VTIQRTKDALVLVDTTTSEDPTNATDPSSPGDELEHITSIDFTKGRSDIEADEVGDDSKRREQGLSDFQLTLECNFDNSATVQSRLITAEKNASKLIVHYLHDGTNGYENICTVTTEGPSGTPDELQSITFEVKAATGFLWNAV